MGGRGGSSGMSKGTALDQLRKAGVRIEDEDIKGLNMVLVNKTLQGAIDTLKAFGLPVTTINGVGISLSNKSTTVASVNGFGDFGFSRKTYQQKINEFPKDGWVVDYSARGTGTHEAGHLISDYIMKKTNSHLSILEKANLRSSGKWDRQILKQAKKENGGKLSAISKYGSSTKGKAASEVVAEAVAEYMKKGKKASPSSKAIVKVLKSYL